MKISDNGLRFIAAHEGGAKLKVYDDGAGKPTIGIGHLLHSFAEYPDGITLDEAMEMFRRDCRWVEVAVNSAVRVELSQFRFDALADLVFNVGAGAFNSSTLVRRLNEGDYGSVPSEMMRWTKAGGVRLKGLVKRRHACTMLWWFQIYEPGY